PPLLILLLILLRLLILILLLVLPLTLLLDLLLPSQLFIVALSEPAKQSARPGLRTRRLPKPVGVERRRPSLESLLAETVIHTRRIDIVTPHQRVAHVDGFATAVTPQIFDQAFTVRPFVVPLATGRHQQLSCLQRRWAQRSLGRMVGPDRLQD